MYLSLRIKGGRLCCLCVLFTAAIAAAVFLIMSGADNIGREVSLTASDSAKYIAAHAKGLESFSEIPAEIKAVTIPEEWDDFYNEYNNIQIIQSFNLKSYKGRAATLWSYDGTALADGERVRINILTSGDKIIAADISVQRPDGEVLPLS